MVKREWNNINIILLNGRKGRIPKERVLFTTRDNRVRDTTHYRDSMTENVPEKVSMS